MKQVKTIVLAIVIVLCIVPHAAAQSATCSLWSSFDFYEYDYTFSNNTGGTVTFTVTESATIFAPAHSFTTDPLPAGMGMGRYPLIAYPPNVYGTATVHIAITCSSNPGTPVASYDFTHRRIAENDAVLVLDKSGSMGLPGKLDSVKIAAAAFIDAMAPTTAATQGTRYNRYGLVFFNQQADFLIAKYPTYPPPAGTGPNSIEILTPRPVDFLVPVDRVNAPVIAEMNNVGAGGTTSMGAGLNKSRLSIEEKATDMRRLVLLLSDGMENTAPWIADEEQAYVNDGIKVYSIGFGPDYLLDAAKLQNLSARTGGLYRHIDDPSSLSKYFMEALAEGFDMGVLVDPVDDISAGQQKSYDVPVSSFDKDLVFVLTWRDPAKELKFQLNIPGRKPIAEGATENGITYIWRKQGYKIIKVTPSACGCRTPAQWQAVISAGSGVNERFDFTVLSRSSVNFSVPALAYHPAVGKAIPLNAGLFIDGKKITDAKVTVTISMPAEDYLAKIKKTDHPTGKPLDEKYYGETLAELFRKGWAVYNGKAIKRKTVELMLDKNRDAEKTGWLYTAVFRDIKFPGNYDLHFKTTWKTGTGEVVVRECNRTVFVSP